jgi:hypothetical protein
MPTRPLHSWRCAPSIEPDEANYVSPTARRRLPHLWVALATAFEMNRVCEAGARQPLSIRYETLWPK